jgi:hypothetical protein
VTYTAQVFRVLIASPEDVSEERKLAVDAIQRWNDLNSAERHVVLLPVRWETHSAPEFGKRPQEVINRQVVDNCDLLIGVFWTRVGSPTGIAESGTIEEIERFAEQGKPVMLYFSTVKQNPDEIEPDQLKRLREFKEKISKKALFAAFSSPVDFRDKLQQQIEIQVKALLSAQNSEAEGLDQTKPETDIHLGFADAAREGHCTEITLESAAIVVPDFDAIPDYTSRDDSRNTSLNLLSSFDNANYYRELAQQFIQQRRFLPVTFWLKNKGTIGARDIYIEIMAESDSEDTNIVFRPVSTFHKIEASQMAHLGIAVPARQANLNSFDGVLLFRKVYWATVELAALQPKREIIHSEPFYVGAERDTSITLTAVIYADTLPEPVTRKLSIKVNVKRIALKAKDLMPVLKREQEADSLLLGESLNSRPSQTLTGI